MRFKLTILTLAWVLGLIVIGAWGRYEYWERSRGSRALAELRSSYRQGKYSLVLSECDRHSRSGELLGYQPHLLFLRWATLRRMGDEPGVAQVQNEFFLRFPDHPFVVDIHIATANERLELSDYAGMQRELEAAIAKCPSAVRTAEARRSLRDLHRRLLASQSEQEG